MKTTPRFDPKPAFRLLVAGAGIVAAQAAHAGPFEIAASPSLFEITGKSGSRVGQSVTIYNLGNAATDLAVRTLDWTFSPEGQVGYHDALQAGSCRPWVTLERRTVRIGARSNMPFRFQVQIPADAPKGECRFMIALEGAEPAQMAVIKSKGASMSLPVTGRIAIPVYLATDGAQPKLEMLTTTATMANGKKLPAVTVRNSGDAHGRLAGSLDATDAKGAKYELLPDGGPILPGQTRTLALSPKLAEKQPAPEWPLKASGTLEWDLGGFKLNAAFQ